MMNLRIGVIGCGSIGKAHIRRLTDEVNKAEVTAVFDTNLETAKEAAGICGAKIFGTDTELIQSEEVDAVLVTTPANAHTLAVIKTIAAGKYCFCEKPMALTSKECRQVVEAEAAGGKHLVQVGFMCHYDIGYKKMKAMLYSGQMGNALTLHSVHREVEKDEIFTTNMMLSEAAIHEIDISHWLLDDYFITAQVIKPRKTKYVKGDLCDPLILILRTAKHIIVEIEISCNSKFAYDIQCEVACEEGTITMPQPPELMLRMEGVRGVPLKRSITQHYRQVYVDELQDWVNSSLNECMRGPSAWDGYLAAIAVEACIQALGSEKIEDVPFRRCPVFYRKREE